MSLADNIRGLEKELEYYQSENNKLNAALNDADDRIENLEYDCEDMGKFIEYIDNTHPELRVAYNASQKLEGAKT